MAAGSASEVTLGRPRLRGSRFTQASTNRHARHAFAARWSRECVESCGVLLPTLGDHIRRTPEKAASSHPDRHPACDARACHGGDTPKVTAVTNRTGARPYPVPKSSTAGGAENEVRSSRVRGVAGGCPLRGDANPRVFRGCPAAHGREAPVDLTPRPVVRALESHARANLGRRERGHVCARVEPHGSAVLLSRRTRFTVPRAVIRSAPGTPSSTRKSIARG